MGKADELRRASGSNILESMGAGRAAVPGEPTGGARVVPARLQGITRAQDAAHIPLDKIVRDEAQPREEFEPEALGRLAESLKARGQLQPIRVRWDEGRGAYVLICGERRFRAAQLAGMPTMSCVIVDRALSPAELLAVQVTENALREDLRPVEAARAYRALMDLNGWTVRQLAGELSVTHSAIVKALALLDLPAPIQEQVDSGTLPASLAYEVSRLETPEEQAEVAAVAVAGSMTRDEVAETVRRKVAASKPAKGRAPKKRPTERTYRTSAGKVTVENRKGLDGETLIAALREALDQAEAEAGQGRAGAA